MLERPEGHGNSAAALGLAGSTVLALWPSFKAEVVSEDCRMLRSGDLKRSELSLILAAIDGRIKEKVSIAISGEIKREARAAKQRAALAAQRYVWFAGNFPIDSIESCSVSRAYGLED